MKTKVRTSIKFNKREMTLIVEALRGHTEEACILAQNILGTTIDVVRASPKKPQPFPT